VNDLDALRYPVGRFERLIAPLDRAARDGHLGTLEQTPARLRSLVSGRSNAQLDATYRPGGWTVRQVVHHVADSHLNAYLRFKWALTEHEPEIKVYDERLWAELPDAKTGNVDLSLALLDALHRRWLTFLRSIPDASFARAFLHPDWKRMTIDEAVAMYAWHCRHHAAHIELGLRG
jgi:hypothetical protein